MTSVDLIRWRWLGPVALMIAVAGGVAASSLPPSPAIAVGSYGPGIGADSLANMQIGGTSSGSANQLVAYRFRASQSAALNSIRIYLVDGAGYAGGTGGTLSISVQTDDGSASHAPSGTILASKSVTPGNPIAIGYLPLITFPSPATLVAGQLYHIVFTNTDPNPTVNYVSVDGLSTNAVATPRQPTLSDLDWGQLLNDRNHWTVRQNYTPILDLGYANGVHAGMGYMEVWASAPKPISGSNAVREIFTPRSAHSVSSVSVRVRRISGASPLTVKLIESASGTILAQGQISAASIGSTASWVTAGLPETVLLREGASYQLVLSASSESEYSVHAIERGNNYHFAAATYFSDGYAQYTTSGLSWAGFDQPGGSSNNDNSDLQFYLR